MKKDSVIDVDFEEWYALYDKYKEKDMGCKEVRESLEKDFTELSTKWWNVILSDFALEDNECSLDYCIAEIWFDGDYIDFMEGWLQMEYCGGGH